MRYPTSLENIVRTATLTATNVVASSAFELLSRDAVGGGTVDLSGSYTGADDAVIDIEVISDTINGTPLYEYSYIWDEPGVRHVGVMAQEAPPHAVIVMDNGFLAVDYGSL
mgnify:CR=1 FL=1